MKKNPPAPSRQDQASRHPWLEKRHQLFHSDKEEAEELELARRNAERPIPTKVQHEQNRARHWRAEERFQTTRTKEGVLTLKPAGPTVRRRFVGKLRGAQLGKLRRFLNMSPRQWQQLDEPAQVMVLVGIGLDASSDQPFETIQQQAAEALEVYKQEQGARVVLAEIIHSGDFESWLSDQWFLTALRAAVPLPGKGNQPTLSREERPRSRKEATARAKAIKRLVARAKAQQAPPFSLPPKGALRQVIGELEDKYREPPRRPSILADSQQRRVILQEVKKRVLPGG